MIGIVADARVLVAENQAWAGPIIAAITFVASSPFIGMLLPGTALMLVFGGMVGMGLLDFGSVAGWALAGTIAGNWLSFEIGRSFGMSAFQRWPRLEHRPAVIRARDLFCRYGMVSVMLARFSGPFRATIPLVAGTMRMRQRTFHSASITSGAIWVFALLTPGMLAVRAIGGSAAPPETQALLIGIVLVVTILLGAVAAGSMFFRWLRTPQPHDPPETCARDTSPSP